MEFVKTVSRRVRTSIEHIGDPTAADYHMFRVWDSGWINALQAHYRDGSACIQIPMLPVVLFGAPGWDRTSNPCLRRAGS